jgi:hypothetical protein
MAADAPDLASRLHLRVVSWRTLHQRVAVVEITEDGDPIVVVGTERLVLPRRARHFRRFVDCAVCGTSFVGPHPVMSPADLHAPGRPAICASCSRPGRLHS